MGKAAGLEQVHAPAGNGKAELDIVFVHGLFGDRRRTWTWTEGAPKAKTSRIFSSAQQSPKLGSRYSLSSLFSRSKRKSQGDFRIEEDQSTSGHNGDTVEVGTQSNRQVFWPKDLLPKSFPKSRVFTWGYDVDIDHVFSGASTATVFQHAYNLLSDVADVRIAADEKTRPLIFIAHSLGGIVVKDALNQSRSTPTHLSEILPATLGVCFLGTPHRGSPTAGLAETIYRISNLWGKSPNLRVLQALKYDAETLDRVQAGFRQTLYSHQVNIRSFREAEKTSGMVIVDRFSSIFDHPLEIVSDIQANHRDMTKFGSTMDAGYNSICTALLRWMLPVKKENEKLPRILNQIREECLQSLENWERTSRIAQVEDPYLDTFSWLMEDKYGFTKWLQSWPPQHVFWIQGKPGSGKSTLMKYAAQHEDTRRLLDKTPVKSWKLITFFFHDRGSQIQKTTDGLLQEILYQLIKEYPDLIEFLVPIRIQAIMSSSAKSQAVAIHEGRNIDIERLQSFFNSKDQNREGGDDKTHKARKVWSSEEVEEGLKAVTMQKDVPMNVCIFIDALDEHNGNHRKLVEILYGLAAQNSQNVNIKLCLASRQEPIFQDVFGLCPSFAIHEHTRKDVHKFAYGRLESSLTSSADENELKNLHDLAEDITQRARGVFIWVKLVVEELVERVVDGNTIAQLQRVLLSIPDELQALYQRVVDRRKTEYALEFYVMIQVILKSRTPQTLSSLMTATDIAITGTPESMTERTMERRLASRSGGLLELAQGQSTEESDESASTFSESAQRRRNTTKAANYRSGPTKKGSGASTGTTVQFLHQTVKSFFQIQQNAISMFKSPEDVPIGDGSAYLLRFCIYIATDMHLADVEKYSKNLLDLFPYAADLEANQENNTTEILDSLLSPTNCSDDLSSHMRKGLAGQLDGLHVWEHFCLETAYPIHYDSIHFGGRLYDLVVYAASHGLYHYLKRKLEQGLPLTRHRRAPVLYGACCSAIADIWAHESLEGNRAITMQSPQLLRLLLDALADPNADYMGVTPLGFLIRACSTSDSGSLLAISWESVLECIELLVQRGADVNASVGTLKHTAPLCFALLSQKYSIRLSKLLLKYGANHKLKDKDGFYPLFYTIESGKADTTELLLDYGADPRDVGHGINVLDLKGYKGDKNTRIGGLVENARKMEGLLRNYSDVTGVDSRCNATGVKPEVEGKATVEELKGKAALDTPNPPFKSLKPQFSW